MAGRAEPAVELVIEAGTATDTGRRRRNNEDWMGYFEPTDPTVLARRGRLYLVADGVGGGAVGEVASEYAGRKVLYSYYSQPDDAPPEECLLEAIQEANADVHEHTLDYPSRSSMGSTLVAALVVGGNLWVANVGDSRAYLVRDGTITQLTRDHSLVAGLVEEGIITPQEAQTHPQRNVILRSLGAEPEVRADLFAYAFAPGDRLILCSDGLTRHVTDEEICDTVLRAAPARAAQRLIGMANGRGGSDNITALVLQAGQWAPAEVVARAAAARELSSPHFEAPTRGLPTAGAGRSAGPVLALGVAALLLAAVLLVAVSYLSGLWAKEPPPPTYVPETAEPVLVETSLPPPTPLPTASETSSPTAAVSPTATGAPSPTAGQSATARPSITRRPTRTPRPSRTPSATPGG